jgi:F-type H+/Na+-transporting ATPase subunit alpha
MSVNPISQLETELSHFTPTTSMETVGEIIEIGDGIALIQGLDQAVMGEVIMFPNNISGVVLNLNTDTIGAIILGDDKQLKSGDLVKPTGRLLSIPVADTLLGRVVSPLGKPLDGGPEIRATKSMPLEQIAPSVFERAPVDTPLQTGILAIDSMIPVGKGQRQLIIGDRGTGKSAIALTTMINQKESQVICIYVAIGQKRAGVAQTIDLLSRTESLAHTIIVSATASDPASIQYLAPYAGTAIAEYFARDGKDVLIVYDDLSKHAWAYREVSLLLRRPSGREAYPGDIFYLHSRLLERGVRFNQAQGGGSITALPIIETQAGDVSAYIPTNVISITDGQIFLDTGMFMAGQRPAVDIGLSVSRVGGAAQRKTMKQVVGSLKIDMAQYREMAAFAQFSSDLDAKTKAKIDHGKRITELLKQGWDKPVPVDLQVILFWAVSHGYLDHVLLSAVVSWQNQLYEYFETAQAKLVAQIGKAKAFTPAIEAKLKAALATFEAGHPDLYTLPEIEE